MRVLLLFGVVCLALLAAAAKPLATLTGANDWKAWKAAGAWTWNGAWVGGAGDNTWRYAECGDAKWADYRLDATLRIDTATPRRDPKWEAGGWIWAHYRNNAEIGGYEAGLTFRRQGKDFYRLMFSVPHQEVLLWSTRGGFLQVAPCKLEAGKPIQISVMVVRQEIMVSVDGNALMSYFDRAAPLLTGGVGLGLHEGAAAFSAVTVTPVTAPKASRALPVADFRVREWKGERWIMDRREPIAMIGRDCKGHEVKTVPGYQPQYMMYWHWLNYGDETFYADKLKAVNVLEEGKQLRVEIISTDKGKDWLTSRTAITLSYDAVKHCYVYDHVSDLTIADGHTLRVSHPLEFTDPCAQGHVGSASPKTVEWPTPHPWSVYKHVSGKLYKHPHNHNTWYPGFAKPAWQQAKGNYLANDGGFWALVGDPVANPVMTVQSTNVKDAEFYTELCGWAFDVHMRLYPGKPGATHTLQPGTYTVKWQLTSVDGKQGTAWLQEAGYCAAEDLEKQVLLYTGGIGHVEEFDTVAKWASPYYTYPLGDAALRDATVGHGDATSLKIVGPREAGAMVGGSVYSDPVQPDTVYELSAWVKTLDAKGEGPGMSFGGNTYHSRITGTNDWRQIKFVCKPNEPLHTVSFSLFNSGAGTVWFDDFQIRPLKKDEVPPFWDVPPDNATRLVKPELRMAWNSTSDVKDPGRTLLDLSGRGNHLRLEGPATMSDDGGRVLTLDGEKAYATGGSFECKPPQSFTVWVKPGQLTHDWNIITTGGAWNRAWMLFLYYKQSPYCIDFRPWGKRIFVESVAPKDAWTHIAITDDGKKIVIYVNGKSVKEDASTGNAWAALPGPLVLGNALYYEEPKNGFVGAIADTAFWNTALAPDAVKALYDGGRK